MLGVLYKMHFGDFRLISSTWEATTQIILGRTLHMYTHTYTVYLAN